MIHHDTANNLKLVDFTDSEVKAFVLGVVPIAGLADMRGSFTVGQAPASAKHVAAKARVSVKVAESTLVKLRALGMLETHDDGIEWVHDFQEYNPEPRVDDTAAERAARYRQRQKAKRDLARGSGRLPKDQAVAIAEIGRKVLDLNTNAERDAA